MKGLLDEPRSMGQLVPRGPPFARHHDDLDRRPAISHHRGKLETVHGTRHINVRKNHPNILAALEYSYCFVSICSFNYLKARIFDRSDGIEANEQLILDDQDRRCF